MLLFEELSYAIVGAAMEVHQVLGPGFLEAVYEKALSHEFRRREILFDRQVRLPVSYKGELVGDYTADFLVERKIIVELKAVSAINQIHYAQVHHYLTSTNLRLGLLLNFGAPSLQWKRIIGPRISRIVTD